MNKKNRKIYILTQCIVTIVADKLALNLGFLEELETCKQKNYYYNYKHNVSFNATFYILYSVLLKCNEIMFAASQEVLIDCRYIFIFLPFSALLLLLGCSCFNKNIVYS